MVISTGICRVTSAQRLSASQVATLFNPQNWNLVSKRAQRLSASQVATRAFAVEKPKCSGCAQRLSASQVATHTACCLSVSFRELCSTPIGITGSDTTVIVPPSILVGSAQRLSASQVATHMRSAVALAAWRGAQRLSASQVATLDLIDS